MLNTAAPDPVHHERRSRRTRSARAREDRRTGYLLISPTVVIVFTMVVLPILWTFSLAFQHVRLLNLRRTGIFGDYSLDNFRSVLTSPGFLDALVTTLVYSVFGTAFAIGLGLLAMTMGACATLGGAAIGAGTGAAIGAGTGHGAGKGALIGTGVGAAAGTIYGAVKK